MKLNTTESAPIGTNTPARFATGAWPLLIAALVAAGAGLTGCNTTEGAGRDIQEAGSAIEDAAD